MLNTLIAATVDAIKQDANAIAFNHEYDSLTEMLTLIVNQCVVVDIMRVEYRNETHYVLDVQISDKYLHNASHLKFCDLFSLFTIRFESFNDAYLHISQVILKMQ